MSGTKVIGSAGAAGAASTLPLTGSPVMTIATAAVALTVGGLLLMRSGRLNKNSA